MIRPTTQAGLLFLSVTFCLPFVLGAQTNPVDTVAVTSPDKVYASLSKKSLAVENRLDRTTEKYLQKLLRQEAKLRDKVAKVDLLKAKEIFSGIEEKYVALQSTQKLSNYSQVHSGHPDSLTVSLNFLKATGLSSLELKSTLVQCSTLQVKLDQTEAVKKFLSERKRLLKENLEKPGMLKEWKDFSKQAYYCSAQSKEYKQLWQEPTKLERILL